MTTAQTIGFLAVAASAPFVSLTIVAGVARLVGRIIPRRREPKGFEVIVRE